MKLYELTNEVKQLQDMLDSETDVPAEVIADTLEAVHLEIADKADSIACLLKNIDADISAIKAEEKNLSERRKSKEAAYNRIKTYLSDELVKANVPSIETARNRISFRKSKAVELIVDESAFIEWAETYRDDVLTYSVPKINKTAIKNALDAGESIAGAQIVEKSNIQIK